MLEYIAREILEGLAQSLYCPLLGVAQSLMLRVRRGAITPALY
jgi:hypothetical protein